MSYDEIATAVSKRVDQCDDLYDNFVTHLNPRAGKDAAYDTMRLLCFELLEAIAERDGVKSNP